MQNKRKYVALPIDYTSSLWVDFLKALDETRELTPFIMDLLTLYHEDAVTREVVKERLGSRSSDISSVKRRTSVEKRLENINRLHMSNTNITQMLKGLLGQAERGLEAGADEPVPAVIEKRLEALEGLVPAMSDQLNALTRLLGQGVPVQLGVTAEREGNLGEERALLEEMSYVARSAAPREAFGGNSRGEGVEAPVAVSGAASGAIETGGGAAGFERFEERTVVGSGESGTGGVEEPLGSVRAESIKEEFSDIKEDLTSNYTEEAGNTTGGVDEDEGTVEVEPPTSFSNLLRSTRRG